MSALLMFLVICWVAVAVLFFAPAIKNSRQFASINALGRMKRNDGPLSELPGFDHVGEPHIAAEPHAAPMPRRLDRVWDYMEQAPQDRAEQARTVAVQSAPVVSGTVVFDEWTGQYVNEDGEVVDRNALPTRAAHSVELNPRAEAYSRPLATPQQVQSYAISARRQAALRRRQVLKWMAIAIAGTTVPALLTGWGLFVFASVMTWLAFATWFSLMIYFMIQQDRTAAPVNESAFMPDNIVPLRPRTTPAEPAAHVETNDEFYSPSPSAGFARAQFAVGQ